MLPEPTTLAVFGSHLLVERSGAQEVLRDHWVLLEGRRIAAITPTRPGADIVLDRPGRFVLPGLINLHNHCFSEMIARTHTEDGAGRKNDRSIIYTVLMPLTRIGLERYSPEERMAVARLGMLQLLKGGNATVMEPFRNGMPEMFAAAEEMGLRFYGAPYLMSTPDAQEGADGVVRYRGDDGAADLATWAQLHETWQGRDHGRIRLALSPHATDTCGPDLLRTIAARARELGVLNAIHLAQSKGEVATIRERHGRTPAEYLDWLGVLNPDLLAAHCIACTDEDLGLMARRGVTVLNCPRVFARAGIVANFARFRAHGLRTAVATDGYNLDLLGELHAAAIISKTQTGDAEVATAPELIDAVTREAAAAIRRPDLGVLRVGATADLTVVDLSHPHLQPLYDPRRALVWLANRANIDSVIVDGRLLVEGGRYLHADEAAVTAAGVAAIEKLWALPEARAAFAG
ncbi:MAG: amidohydrolase family protein [Alphaproteobacteria bacterium]|nr:amidohydrolase family protein [Alphaproteobacteria bacterium]